MWLWLEKLEPIVWNAVMISISFEIGCLLSTSAMIITGKLRTENSPSL